MYYRVLQDELQFPEDRTMDQDTKSLIRGVRSLTLMCEILALIGIAYIAATTQPCSSMKEPRIKKHPYFSMMSVSPLASLDHTVSHL